MNKIVLVLGSPGAGKTSVVSSVGKKYKIVNVGDVMTEVGVKKRMIKNRDEIRYMTNDDITKLRTIAFREIGKMKGNIVVDTHATVEQHGRFFPGMPDYFRKYLSVVGIIYIDASDADIRARRQKDKTRVREREPDWTIETQRDINLAMMAYYSTSINIPLYVIVNAEGRLREAQSAFIKNLKDAFGK